MSKLGTNANKFIEKNGIFESIASRLKEQVKRQGITQVALSKDSGLSPAAVSKAVNKKANLFEVARLSCALGVSMDYLCGLVDAESIPRLALMYLQRLIRPTSTRSQWGTDTLISTISVGRTVREYIEACFYTEILSMSEELKKEWLQQKTANLLNQIESNANEEETTYAVIDIKYITPEVERALETAKLNVG